MRSESTRFFGQPRLTKANVPLGSFMKFYLWKGWDRRRALRHRIAANEAIYLNIGYVPEVSSNKTCQAWHAGLCRQIILHAIAHEIDALGAAAQKREHFLNDIDFAEVFFHLGHGGGEHQTFAEEHFERLAHSVDLFTRHAGAFHTDDVDAADIVQADLNDERRNVLLGC